ncbi:aliphatic sulfonate ABC transporter substrate-binding protein [Roseomonas marmotae]|uniref:Aliphatic sulfonate ABC transporter substrate-binding protein n=1 Tax=Roseomonas marmotae TaxID=2768161 RepID=A0ABS3K740_9PROT|nr:aliphatic sulfonate ABC transporter substrate-binding protein [Roseomonas marmotae]MBO1073282.1 aliphatic sulfonate ABC transporter substrate-binding protein [Roseomonas marmotae]QTI79099.1 aliphatic sulfonate ABC transporter substrate-binding protein [Roseomonas marmotae]
MHRRTLGKLSAALLFPKPFLSARAAGGGTVRIGWLRAPNDITTGRARGTLEQALAALGAKVEWAGPFPAAAPALEALNAGSIDITAGSSTACIAALAARIPMVIFAYQKMSAGAEGILVKQDSPIQGLADLRGRSVAVNRGGTGEYLLMRALEKNGIDASGVKRVYLSPSDSGAAFRQGHVDAWATWDPFIAIGLKSYGARVLADGAAIGSGNAVTLMASRDFVEQKQPLLQAVFQTCLAENAWARQNKAEAGRIWTEAMSIPAGLAPTIGENNAVPTRGVTDADIAQIEQIADWYVSSRIVPRRPDIGAGVVKLTA